MSESLERELGALIRACEDALIVMQDSIMTKHWDRFNEEEAVHTTEMKKLQELCENHRDEVQALDEIYVTRLQQLSIRQRRIMRLVSAQMQAISEDIAGIDKGERRLRQFSELLSS